MSDQVEATLAAVRRVLLEVLQLGEGPVPLLHGHGGAEGQLHGRPQLAGQGGDVPGGARHPGVAATGSVAGLAAGALHLLRVSN